MIFFWELHVLYILKWIVILKWQELEDLCSMEDKHETLRKWWLFVLGILISLQIVIILAGNGVVLFTLNKYKFHLSLATKYFISSMAVADILLGVVHLPLVMASHIGGNKVAEIQSVCIIRQASAIGIYSAILCNHFAVAVDRYIAILHPLRYHALMKIRNIVFVLIIIWTSSCFLMTLPVITDLTKGSHSRMDKILFCMWITSRDLATSGQAWNSFVFGDNNQHTSYSTHPNLFGGSQTTKTLSDSLQVFNVTKEKGKPADC